MYAVLCPDTNRSDHADFKQEIVIDVGAEFTFLEEKDREAIARLESWYRPLGVGKLGHTW